MYVSAKILNGDPTVRWGDKSYNLIAFSNGVFGSNCDVSKLLKLLFPFTLFS